MKQIVFLNKNYTFNKEIVLSKMVDIVFKRK